MGAKNIEEWLFAKSGCHLIDFCRKFGYYPLALKIMALDENDEKKSKAIMAKDIELKNHYLKCAKDPYTIRRKGKNRSFTQYFKDVISGWVVEDLVIEMLKAQGIEVEHNGHDAQRRIAIGNDVTQEADIRIKVGKVVRKVELTNECNCFLTKHGFIEKRAPALIRLWNANGIWIYRDLASGKYVLIDFATEKVKLHLRRHNNVLADWAKDVHRYVLEENGKKIREDRLLAAEIISVVGCSIDGKEHQQIEEIVDQDSPPQDYTIGGVRKQNVIESQTGEKHTNTKHLEVEAKEKNKQVQAQPVSKQKMKLTQMAKQDEVKVPPREDECTQEEEVLPTDYDYGDGDFV